MTVLHRHQHQHKRRGTVLMYTAAIAIGLIAFAGLAVDVGYMQGTKAAIQTAADAAAFAAGREALGNANAAPLIRNAARVASKLNGFEHGVANTSVTVNQSAGQIEVIVSRNTPSYFMRMVGVNQMALGARAVVKYGGGLAAPACVYVLKTTGQRTFMFGGQSRLTTDCGIQVNSSDAAATYWDAGACVTAATFAIAGAFQPAISQWPFQGGCTPATGGQGFVQDAATSPARLVPDTGAAAKADPLAALAPPAVGACTQTISIDASTAPVGQPLTLNPGTYCGIYVGGQRTVTFNPGLYILRGGRGLTVDADATVSGAGVTFYVTSDNTGAAASISPVVFSSGNVRATFTAPTTGTYQGILFFGDRSTPSGVLNQINGNATARFDGTIYLPSSGLIVTGSGTGLNVNGNYAVIAHTITVNGQARFNLTSGGAAAGGASGATLALIQ